MRWPAAACLLFLSAPLAAATPRVASFGVCADQFLLMLADDHQIASLSAQATSPLSRYAARARRFPENRGVAEEIIDEKVDVLLISDNVSSSSAAALAGFGVKVVQIPQANDWDDIETTTRRIARAIGREARGEQLIADMHARLARLRPRPPKSQWPTALYYRPDGGGAGAGTFVDAALEAAGFRNLQVTLGPPMWGGVPVERIVRDPPDLFVVSYFDTNTNNSSVLRRNPVLWGAARSQPVLNLPGKYWNCGSPLLAEAAEQLAAARERIFPKAIAP